MSDTYPHEAFLRKRSKPPRHRAGPPRHVARMPSKEADRTIRRRTRRVRGSRFFEWTMIIVLALALSSFVRAFLMQAFWIPSSSMEETLQIGDNVVVSRLTPRFFDIERGDVVVFRDAEGWLPPPEEKRGVSKVVDRALTFTGLRPASGEQHLVKRVIGVGGDTVSCCDPEGKIQVNGVPISEPYLAPGADNTRIPFEVTVPEGHLWVMGDNRNRSADSRVHLEDAPSAFINQDDVVGRVFWITWPVNHWGNPTSNDPFDAVK